MDVMIVKPKGSQLSLVIAHTRRDLMNQQTMTLSREQIVYGFRATQLMNCCCVLAVSILRNERAQPKKTMGHVW